MEMVKLSVHFFIIKCLGSSAWPERCLGKAKVAGSIPAQGFLFCPKGGWIEPAFVCIFWFETVYGLDDSVYGILQLVQ